MARVLAAKANGELEKYIIGWPIKQQKLNKVTKAEVKVDEKPKVKDIEEWLRVSYRL